ncbi:MAG TPA: STAS domain-containing protein [Bryobacteraceae bacterium]|nr:STAS domain-containing protein [Bryobacteraceae bacterium]
MRFEQTNVGDVLVAKVMESRIVAEVAPRFKHQLVDYISNGNRAIVLDLQAVNFIDSSGLGALVSTLKTMGRDGDLVLCGTGGTVVSMFKLTRMDKVFRMFGTAEEAIAALASGRGVRCESHSADN